MTRDFVGFAESHFVRRSATQLLKDLIGRERPRLEFAEEDGLGPGSIEELDEKDGNHQSFPSGHASGAFGYASYMERIVARELGLESTGRKFSFAAFYGLAGWIAWGRLRVDKHYLTDVVAGAALGTWISRSAYRHSHPEEYGQDRVAHRDGGRRIRFLPPTPLPGGILVTAVIRLGPGEPPPAFDP